MRIQNNSLTRSNELTKNETVAKNKASAAYGAAKRHMPQPGLNEALISRAFLKSLAEDYKKGLIDGKEANSRFISKVAGNSLNGILGENDKQKLIAHITDFFSDDPDFLHNLERNLNKL